MIHETYNEGMLPRSSRRPVLTLIYKKGDKDLIKNYRPISLSNYDYKIIAFVLASRIQRVIDKIINKTQTAYIKGRYIGLNARFMLDILEYSNITKKKGAIICLDFEKPFDTVDWPFMLKTLENLILERNLLDGLKYYVISHH